MSTTSAVRPAEDQLSPEARRVVDAFAAAGLRCFRHFPCVNSRKGWAAGDAASRAVWLALMAMRGEPGCPLVLSAPVWGFQARLRRPPPVKAAAAARRLRWRTRRRTCFTGGRSWWCAATSRRT